MNVRITAAWDAFCSMARFWRTRTPLRLKYLVVRAIRLLTLASGLQCFERKKGELAELDQYLTALCRKSITEIAIKRQSFLNSRDKAMTTYRSTAYTDEFARSKMGMADIIA